jgi:hypothetical protein
MWLLLRKNDIARAYGEAWQHVEAFRRLLRTTARPIDGTPAEPHGRARHRAAAARRLARAKASEQEGTHRDKWA